MDDRTLKFASIYELETKAQWAGVGRAVTKGLGKGLSRGVSALRGGAGAIGKGVGSAERAVAKGISTGVGAAANAERAVAKTTANAAKKFISKVETSPEAKKILTDSKLRLVRDPRTKVETLTSIHGDQAATIKALRQAGHHPADIRNAVRAARQTFTNTKKMAKIRAWQMSRNRSADNLENMVATAFTGAGIKGVLARNPVRSAIAVSLGLGALYLSLTGKPASAATPDGQEIVKSVTSSSSAIIPELINQIDIVLFIATNHPEVAQSLTAAKTALAALSQTTLSVDDPASGTAFTQKVQAAEAAVNTAFEKVGELEDAVGDQVPQVDELQGGFGEFLVSVGQARSSIASSKTAAAYVDVYYQSIVKEAWVQALLLLVPLVGNLVDTLVSSSGNVDKVKQNLNRMVEMIDEKGKEPDGFGKFKDIFTTFRNNAKTTADLIDGMVKPASNTQDPTQLNNCQKFVEVAGNTVTSFDSVIGALNDLQGFWGGVGNFMQAAVGGWGGNWNDYQEFSQLVKQTKDPLSALQGQMKGILDKAQTQIQTSTTSTTDSATGLAGMANIKL